MAEDNTNNEGSGSSGSCVSEDPQKVKKKRLRLDPEAMAALKDKTKTVLEVQSVTPGGRRPGQD